MRNSRYAAFWICVFALSLADCDKPGNWIKIRLPPAGWMTGSATPNWSTRLRNTSTACDNAPLMSGAAKLRSCRTVSALASAFVSISTRNDVPPCKSRPSLILPEASR